MRTTTGHRAAREIVGPGFIRRAILALGIALATVAAGAPLVAQPIANGPLPQPLPLFPADNWWNLDISHAPVDAHSEAYIDFIGRTRGMHPDFGGDVDPGDASDPEIYGFPYASVGAGQPLVPVTFVDYGDESDDGAPGRPAGYPIPSEAKTQARWIEGGWAGNDDRAGGDRHFLIVDRDRNLLFELYDTRWNDQRGRWEAGSGATFDMSTNGRRPEGWTSADAAGLAIFPGLVRRDEVLASGPIRHAFRVTVERSNGHVWPASHSAGDTPGALPMGARLRLKASVDLSRFPADVQKIFQAMKSYGLIVADNGSDLYVQGTYDRGWDNDVLNPAFAALEAGDFEVVQLGWKPGSGGGEGGGGGGGGATLHVVPRCTVLDTRNARGPGGGPALAPDDQRRVTVAGRCRIPSGAVALRADVSVLQASGRGTLRLFAGADGDAAVTRAFGRGRTRWRTLRLPVASGAFALVQESRRAVQVTVQVTGYYQ